MVYKITSTDGQRKFSLCLDKELSNWPIYKLYYGNQLIWVHVGPITQADYNRLWNSLISLIKREDFGSDQQYDGAGSSMYGAITLKIKEILKK